MSKIFTSIFIITSLLFSVNFASAQEYLKIINRNEWGANENFRYWYSSYWEDIFTKRATYSKTSAKKWKNYSQSTKDFITAKNKIAAEKKKNMNNYLSNNFSRDIKVISYEKFDGENKIAWPISKTNTVKNIVIHHTSSEYKDSYSGIKNIYKYHALNNQWGDIGYNYVIGYDGEIFEGRSGGDYTVGAHDTWNNYSTVGISLMGDYNKRKLSDKQYTSLKKLISYLTKKYGIDLNKKIPYHKECFGENCPNGLKTSYYYPIVGHRDGKSTSCPGENLYHDTIPKLLKELQPETSGYKNISYTYVQKQEKKYRDKINSYDWKKIKNNFYALPKKQQVQLISKVKFLKNYRIGWKRQILFSAFLEKI